MTRNIHVSQVSGILNPIISATQGVNSLITQAPTLIGDPFLRHHLIIQSYGSPKAPESLASFHSGQFYPVLRRVNIKIFTTSILSTTKYRTGEQADVTRGGCYHPLRPGEALVLTSGDSHQPGVVNI